MSAQENKPREGLWAFYQGKFFGMEFDQNSRDLDHAGWFAVIGLPEYGPEFDEIVRGRLLWDIAHQQHVLLWYTLPSLPNRIYDQVRKFFGVEHHHLIEKPVFCDWM